MPEIEEWRKEIRRARNSKGLSRRSAAELAGMSESAWRNVETGVQHVAGVGPRPYRTTVGTVAQMAAVVGLDAREIAAAAGFDAQDVRLDSIADEQDTDVRIIVVRGNPTTDEVVAEVRRVLGSME
jgi:transcriptional regulator with XRE-family HTH domain